MGPHAIGPRSALSRLIDLYRFAWGSLSHHPTSLESSRQAESPKSEEVGSLKIIQLAKFSIPVLRVLGSGIRFSGIEFCSETFSSTTITG